MTERPHTQRAPSDASVQHGGARFPYRVKFKLPGAGTTRRGNGRKPGVLRRIMVAFDDETFDRLRQMAARDQSSFAEQVRLLVEWGLEAVDE